MACDGTIAEEEIELIRTKAKDSNLFGNLDIEKILNEYVSSINKLGQSFLITYLKELKSSILSEEEQLNVIKLAIEMIEADNEILYAEVKFFKRIRSSLIITDEAILSVMPDKEDYLLPDIAQNDFDFLQNVSFSAIDLSEKTNGTQNYQSM